MLNDFCLLGFLCNRSIGKLNLFSLLRLLLRNPYFFRFNDYCFFTCPCTRNIGYYLLLYFYYFRLYFYCLASVFNFRWLRFFWFYNFKFLTWFFMLLFLMLILKPNFLDAFLLFYLLRSDASLSFRPRYRFLESTGQTLFRPGLANCF